MESPASAITGMATCVTLAIDACIGRSTGASAAEPKRGDARGRRVRTPDLPGGPKPERRAHRRAHRHGRSGDRRPPQLRAASCHGPDGRGRAEGGIAPPNIRWSELTKPYGHRHQQGRVHGPFNERAFERAVKHGVDPSGQRMDAAMPRYAMSAKDLVALRAWLERLDTWSIPGVSEKTLRIGTLLPGHGPSAALGSCCGRCFSVTSTPSMTRGVHGRRLELVVHALPADAAAALDSMQHWLERADVFALLAPLSAGIEEPLSRLAARSQAARHRPAQLYPEGRGRIEPDDLSPAARRD